MANISSPGISKYIAAGLTAIFLTSTISESANAAAYIAPPLHMQFNEASASDNNSCVLTTAYPGSSAIEDYDSENLLLASAYAIYMRDIGLDPSALLAILNASEETGMDFELMVVKAMIESQLGRYNEPIGVNGSARGLFQYMPATWLTVFAWYGADYNDGEYSELAAAITFDERGYPQVADPEIRQQILDLRSDFHVSAFIKAMQMKYEEEPFLRNALGRAPEPVDYYMVHFLGIPRAERFFELLNDHPTWSAVNAFPAEARYNRSVFYNGGRHRSIEQVYERIERLIEDRIENFRAQALAILEEQPCIPLLHDRDIDEPLENTFEGQIFEARLYEPKVTQPS